MRHVERRLDSGDRGLGALEGDCVRRASLFEPFGGVEISVSAHLVFARAELARGLGGGLLVRRLRGGGLMEGEKAFEHARLVGTACARELRKTCAAFGREQFAKVCGARLDVSGESRLYLAVADCEGARELLSRLVVESGGGERSGKLVVECREVSVQTCGAQGALCFERALQGEQRAPFGDARPRPAEARLKRDGLLRQLQRARALAVRRVPVGRAD